MIEIKADFHLHTSDDREDPIAHSSRELIDYAAEKSFKAIAITNHNTFTYSEDLRRYAEDRDILLIPGIEKTIEGKHVLLLNAFSATERIKTFFDLQKAREDGVFVIAPHPFYKTPCCLGRKLSEHLELFDAVEYSFFYSRWLNPNRKMLKFAEENSLPVIGNSDCHLMKYFGACHSIIHAEQLTMEAVFSAISKNTVKIVAEPRPFLKLIKVFMEMKISEFKVSSANRKSKPLLDFKAQPDRVSI